MRGLIMLAVLPLMACSVSVSGAGNESDGAGASVSTGGGQASRDYPVSGFTAVDLTGSDDVDVRIGSSFAVHAEGPSDVLDRLKIERDGDTLKIGRKSGNLITIGRSRDAKITVTMPAISGASATGSGSLRIERAAGDYFKGSATGSGELDIAALAVRNGEFSITGSGDIKASGKADSLNMSVAGSGDIDAKGVQASAATVTVMGSGSVTATVNGSASVKTMGSGDVDLGPGARCAIEKLGSGDVTCGK